MEWKFVSFLLSFLRKMLQSIKILVLGQVGAFKDLIFLCIKKNKDLIFPT